MRINLLYTTIGGLGCVKKGFKLVQEGFTVHSFLIHPASKSLVSNSPHKTTTRTTRTTSRTTRTTNRITRTTLRVVLVVLGVVLVVLEVVLVVLEVVLVVLVG